MAFPSSPVNGQTATVDSITYTYASATNSWKRQQTNAIKSTTSSTPPSSPTVGDTWYDTTNDIIYRYTYDGSSNYWIDTSSATVSSNASSGGTSSSIGITSISIANSAYTILDDTAVSNTGGYIQLAGSNFTNTCSVIVGSNNVISTTFVNTSILRAQVGAATPSTYHVYVADSLTGSSAIKPNGLTYSSFPVWTTAATISPNGVSNVAFQLSLTANADSSITYSNTSALPANTTLLANGYFYGTISAPSSTIYNFDVKATDAELQDTSRTFSYTVAPSPPWSALFVGSSEQGLRLDDSAGLTLPNSDWTMEWFMRPTNTTDSVIAAHRHPSRYSNPFSDDNYNFFEIYYTGSSGKVRFSTYIAGFPAVEGYVTGINTWNHVAVTRSGTTLSMYMNGTRVQTGTLTQSLTGNNGYFSIGDGLATTGNAFTGYISNFRINNTTALYTGASLVVPTSTLTAIAGTTLLTAQSDTIVDNSGAGLSITNINGVTTTSSVTPF